MHLGSLLKCVLTDLNLRELEPNTFPEERTRKKLLSPNMHLTSLMCCHIFCWDWILISDMNWYRLFKTFDTFSILKNKESSSSTPSAKPETQRTQNSTNPRNLQDFPVANSGKFSSLQRHTVHLSKWSTLIAQITLDVLGDVYFLWGAPWPTRFPLDCHMD